MVNVFMETKELILEAARDEFMSKGFKNASMRSIAKRVGITATALYRHYAGKEEIFEAVVEPAVNTWKNFCESESVREIDLGLNQGPDAMWNDSSQVHMMVDILYTNYEEQKLLFFGSEGTKYSDFFQKLIVAAEQGTFEFMEQYKMRGGSVNDVDVKELHLLISAQYAAFLEMIRHDFSYEEAIHYADTVNTFFRFGWRDFLGF